MPVKFLSDVTVIEDEPPGCGRVILLLVFVTCTETMVECGLVSYCICELAGICTIEEEGCWEEMVARCCLTGIWI